MVPPEFVTRFLEAVAAHQKFLVISHQRPDGDAVGSTLAMGLALAAQGRQVEMWNDDPMPRKFAFLPGAGQWKVSPGRNGDFDVVVSVDNANKKRLGRALDGLRDVKLWINIDHHASNERFGQLNLVDPGSPATGEILFDLFGACGWKVTPEIAESLFVAISTDTGCFTYPSTDAHSFEVSAELVRNGLNVGEVSRQVYESYPLGRFLLMQRFLGRARFASGHRISYSWILPEDYRETGAAPEDSEGLIDHLRAIDGVTASVLFEKLDDGRIRISLRSKDERVDVNRVAQTFGGGGHALAAGARTAGSPEAIEAGVLAELEKNFDRQGRS